MKRSSSFFAAPGTSAEGSTGSDTGAEQGTLHARVGDLEFIVADAFEKVEMEPAEWDRAVERLGGPVYMTWDWLRTWWEFYGNGCRLRLMIFRKDGEIIGLLPLYLQRLGLRPLQLTVARLVGANIPPKVFDPPLSAGDGCLCIVTALEHLVGEGCDVANLGIVSEEHLRSRGLQAFASAVLPAWRPTVRRYGVCTRYRLPGDFEEYLRSIDSKRRYAFRRFVREARASVRVVGNGDDPVEVERAFEAFASLHTQQWEARGMLGHFKAWPDALHFNRKLSIVHAALRRTRLVMISANGELVRAQYGYAWGRKWYLELPARALRTPWDKLGLGPIGVIYLASLALSEGRRCLEGGLGHYDYKLEVGGDEQPAWSLVWLRREWGAVLRGYMVKALQFTLQNVYRKIWYRRIQPRLPLKLRGPLWRTSLNYDF